MTLTSKRIVAPTLSWIAVVVSLCQSSTVAPPGEKCCEGNVCYNIAEPCDAFHVPLPPPQCAEDLDISTLLYTRDYLMDGQQITRDSVPESYLRKKEIVFIVHGWLNFPQLSWMHVIKNETLQMADVNVVIVGWPKGAINVDYFQAASNTRSVGMEIGLIAENLIKNESLDYSLLYCVGHSLGSHVCGHAGAKTTFGRITGLDPAGPWYEESDLSCGLNPSCADRVDVIHTDGHPGLPAGTNLGTMRPVGHVDFYVNGGGDQGFCETDPVHVYTNDTSQYAITEAMIAFACSHLRALAYYMQSIPEDCFKTDYYKCSLALNSLLPNLTPSLTPASCECSTQPVQSMGYYSINYSATGLFYISTNSVSPFCQSPSCSSSKSGSLLGG